MVGNRDSYRYRKASPRDRRLVPISRGQGRAWGAHASMVPEEALEHADSVVIGEAESIWPQAVADADAGRLQPAYWEEEPMDFKRPRLPRREIVDPRNYWSTSVVQTSRGCPRLQLLLGNGAERPSISYPGSRQHTKGNRSDPRRQTNGETLNTVCGCRGRPRQEPGKGVLSRAISFERMVGLQGINIVRR